MRASSILASIGILLLATVTMAYEEPSYEVLEAADEYEVRRYAPYLVAEVDVEGDFDEAGNEAFRLLAGYIFGDNQIEEEMNMTAPVESRPKEEGVRMSMTTPVASTASATDQYTYAFVMERKYTLETLPQPREPRIRLRQQGGRIMAVRRYSGRWTEENYLKNEVTLMEALSADDWRPIETPILARYNSPFTPWFMRRNEVMVEIEWTEGVEPDSVE
jgi:hypothetical protein